MKRTYVSLTETFNITQKVKFAQRERLHKEIEENKERRHKEKLELIKILFKK